MKRYSIPNSDLKASRIAYGTTGISGEWNKNPITADVVKKGAESVASALENGINFFDLADIYAFGKSEQVFGRVLKELKINRQDIIIQSKCGVRFEGEPNSESPGRYDFSYEHIINSVNGSLKRLDIEQLDILLLHRPDLLMEPDEVAKAFADLRDSGKVRYFGVSNFNSSYMTLLQNSMDQPLVVNQLEISIMHHHVINDDVMVNQLRNEYGMAEGLLTHCRLNNIQVQAWTPVAYGRIFNPPAEADERVKNVAAQLSVYAKEKECGEDAVALAWLLRHPAKIQPVIGTTKPQRIVSSCKADDIELSREEWYTLFNLARGKNVP